MVTPGGAIDASWICGGCNSKGCAGLGHGCSHLSGGRAYLIFSCSRYMTESTTEPSPSTAERILRRPRGSCPISQSGADRNPLFAPMNIGCSVMAMSCHASSLFFWRSLHRTLRTRRPEATRTLTLAFGSRSVEVCCRPNANPYPTPLSPQSHGYNKPKRELCRQTSLCKGSWPRLDRRYGQLAC